MFLVWGKFCDKFCINFFGGRNIFFLWRICHKFFFDKFNIKFRGVETFFLGGKNMGIISTEKNLGGKIFT